MRLDKLFLKAGARPRASRVAGRHPFWLLALLFIATTDIAHAQGDFAGKVAVEGGRELYLECRGQGSPPVILVSGYRNDGEIWTVEPAPGVEPVFRAVAAFTRVCAYDRPGTILDATQVSRSDPVAMPRTAEAIVAELHTLLAAANVQGPTVLAAHSLGGLFARLYASNHPDRVSGLVLIDSWQEDLREILGLEGWRAYVAIAEPPPPGLESFHGLEQVDFAAADVAMRAAAAARPLAPMPLYVLSRGRPVALPPNVPAAFDPAAFERAWRQGQDRLAALTPSVRRAVAENSDHYIQIAEPALVIAAIRAVVEALRHPATWPR